MKPDLGNPFAYAYTPVFDYYVIKAWSGQPNRPPAYTPEMVAQHTERVLAAGAARPTRSADARGIMGWTPGWPQQPGYPGDPEITPQPIFAYQIGEDGPETRFRMMITSGNHATEYTGNWVLEGLVNFLAGEDERAQRLRAQAAFYIYPDVNPDGRDQALQQIDLASAPEGLGIPLTYVYEPGGWTEEGRLKEAGRNLALALLDLA